MGINDNLIEDYRNIVTNKILSNEKIVAVLGNDEYDLETADELLWEHLIPQQYVPETVTKTGSFILYDLDEDVVMSRYSTHSTYTELTLYFWVFTHKDMPKYMGNMPGCKNKLRNDILNRELKLEFNSTGGLGIAKNHLIYSRVITSGNYEYMGRQLAFKITDWSDSVRYRGKD